MRIPLVLPSIAPSESKITRSSFSLLRRNGDACVRGEPIAFCVFTPTKRSLLREENFGSYSDDLFAVLLAPADGVVSWESGISRHGWPDIMTFVEPIEWDNETLLGAFMVQGANDTNPLTPHEYVLITNGRRVLEWADVRGGLLPGWYEFVRTWRFSGELSSVTFAKTCSYRHAVLGDQRTSHEFLLAAPRPLHLTYFADTKLLPTIQSLCEELQRTPQEKQEILTTVRSWLGQFVGPEASGCSILLSLIVQRIEEGSPFLQPHRVIQADGVKSVAFPGALVLAAGTEEATILKHKSLALTVSLPQFFRAPSEVVRLLREHFLEPDPPSPNEMSAAYRTVASKLRERGARLFVMNSFVSDAGVALLRPAWVVDVKKTQSYRARSINEILQSLDDEGIITVIDVNSAVGKIGGRHLLGGAHADSVLDAEIRTLLIDTIAGS